MAFASSVFQENAVLSQQGGLSGSWGPKKDLFISEAGFWEVDLASSRGWDLPQEIAPLLTLGLSPPCSAIRQRDSGALLWLVRMAWLCQSSVERQQGGERLPSASPLWTNFMALNLFWRLAQQLC